MRALLFRFLLTVFALLAVPGGAQARAIRIVAFGDSATAGYLVAHNEAYPAQLQAALRKKGYDAIVENAGVNGDTTAGALARFDAAIGPDTDIAIVEFGVNDLRRGGSLAGVRTRLAEIVRALKARHIEVMIVGLGRLDVSSVAQATGAAYAQWTLPPGKYRASDGQHFNAQGYAIVVARMLPQVEALVRRLPP